MEISSLPLNDWKYKKPELVINRLHSLTHGAALAALFYYRITSIASAITKNIHLDLLLPHILIFIAEITLSFIWLLCQPSTWSPVARTAYPDRLPGDEHLPSIDVFVCTADPSKEPSLTVMNTVISAMALDYPHHKLHVYLSDDGGSPVTLRALQRACAFAHLWIPFCRKYSVKNRFPEAYFSRELEVIGYEVNNSDDHFLVDKKDIEILDQIKNHPHPPISLDEQQVESLTEIVTFLQEFLEVYDKHVGYSTEADALEMRIADAAHAAEDVIESHIVDQILADGSSTVHGEGETSSVDFYQDLQRVIDGMELVKKEAMDVREKMGGEFHQPHTNSSTTSVGESRSAFAGQNRVMVGFDEILHQMLDKLTRQKSSREIISIAGMGGMGKTTLAMNICQHQLVVERFDFLAWVTISQDYKMSKILVKLILEGVGENLRKVEDVDELGHYLYQKLWGRRYLILLDDLWDIDVWDRLKFFFPDNNNGSRIMITTRLSNLASKICDSHNIHEMSFLDEDNCWKLFCKLVFGEGDCPLELKRIGMKIVKSCKGLPLSISVVGGLLAKSKPTIQHWEQIAESLNSTVNSEDNEHCLQILYMSYNSLPLHLKPFFLYIGLLSGALEGLTTLFFRQWWTAEGLVKPIGGKSIEEAADEYLSELIDRNLISISSKDKLERNFGECIINVHDLLRDLCLRESQKQNLFCYVGERRSPDILHNKMRQIFVAGSTPEEEFLHIFESAHLLRSIFCAEFPFSSISSSRLLRVAFAFELDNLEDIAEHVNLRFIYLAELEEHKIPSSISRFWNLHALMIFSDGSGPVMMPHEIWMMPQLRSVLVQLLCLPDPPTDCSIILENLHTLAMVCNFKCSEEVVRKIPNIKLLAISYTEDEGAEGYYLNNLVRLQRLQVLSIEVKIEIQSLSMSFPHSLKILILSGTRVHWDDLNTKIGLLPSLQRLGLNTEACIGSKWETVEENFCSLRFLDISECSDLVDWITDQSTHFPRLESLSLSGLKKLNEIPSCIGDIPTLQLIQVNKCSDSVCDSAERIREEQQDYGNEDLQLEVHRQDEDEDEKEDEEEDEDEEKDEDKNEDEDEDSRLSQCNQRVDDGVGCCTTFSHCLARLLSCFGI